MIVGKHMRKKIITLKKDDSVEKAIRLMKRHSIRHLPVVDKDKMLGMITASDLHRAMLPSQSKSKATKTISPLERPVREIMPKKTITITPHTDIEQAASLLHYHKIDGLPVVENGSIVGILTLTDLLEVLIEIMSIIGSSVRLDIVLGKKKGAYDDVCKIITSKRASIISVAMSAHSNLEERIYFFRLKAKGLSPIVKALTSAGYKVVSAIE